MAWPIKSKSVWGSEALTVAMLSYSVVATCALTTVILFLVSVPVLSEQMVVALPMVSHAANTLQAQTGQSIVRLQTRIFANFLHNIPDKVIIFHHFLDREGKCDCDGERETFWNGNDKHRDADDDERCEFAPVCAAPGRVIDSKRLHRHDKKQQLPAMTPQHLSEKRRMWSAYNNEEPEKKHDDTEGSCNSAEISDFHRQLRQLDL
jgi:hypothetical protein